MILIDYESYHQYRDILRDLDRLPRTEERVRQMNDVEEALVIYERYQRENPFYPAPVR